MMLYYVCLEWQVHSMTVDRAVLLLQVSERARQGRLRARFMKEIRDEERKNQRSVIGSTLDPHLSATLIQKVLLERS